MQSWYVPGEGTGYDLVGEGVLLEINAFEEVVVAVECEEVIEVSGQDLWDLDGVVVVLVTVVVFAQLAEDGGGAMFE